MRSVCRRFSLCVLLLAAVVVAPSARAVEPDGKGAKPARLLVVTVTNGFRHSSIESAEGVLETLGRADPFPGGSNLDHDPRAADARLLIARDDAAGALNRGGSVKRQTGIHLGRHTPRHDRQNFTAKAHQQPVHLQLWLS